MTAESKKHRSGREKFIIKILEILFAKKVFPGFFYSYKEKFQRNQELQSDYECATLQLVNTVCLGDEKKEIMERRQERSGKRRKKKKSGLLSNLVLILAVCVFLFSGYQLYQIFSEYKEGEKEYEEIRELVIEEAPEEEKIGEEVLPKQEFTVDFATLQQMNPDTVGWIRFEEPAEISYPVVKGRDNEEYLTRTFEANDNKLGTLFVDKDNTGTFTDRNTIIYGHNMKNGTMFAQLLKYKEQDFFEKYPYFYIYTPDGKEAKYQIFVAGVVEETAVNYQFAFQSDEEFLNYINTIRQTSLYTPTVEITAASQIVTLSTCTNVADEERFVVQAVKVSEQ